MAQVKFYRLTAAELTDLAVNDGRLIFTTDTHKLYLDNGSSRIQIDGVDFTYGLSLNGKTVTITKNGGNGSITLPVVTTEADGLMSAADKIKLNGIATGATAVTVDNSITSSSNNPVKSSAIYTALGNKLETSLKGANSGLAELDANGKVPSSQLPSYVDDVIEGYYYNSKFYKEAAHTTEITGETGKIYVDLSSEKTYRWSGSAFVVISETLALGETDSTAYRGDRGKTAYDHSQVTSGNPHNVTKSDVGLGNVGNFKAVSTVASQGLTDTEKSNARANIGAGTGSSDLTLGTSSSTAYRGDYGNTAYTHATDSNRLTTAQTSGLYKIATTAEGHVKSVTAVEKSDITGLGIPAQDTTYNNATQSAAGLMSSTDKTKLDGIAAQANKTIVDSALSDSSTNPVQNKIVTSALNNKASLSDITVTQTLTSGSEVGKVKVGNTTTTLYAPSPGAVSTELPSVNSTYYLTGVTSTVATSGDQIYNTRMSNAFTGVKYVTSTSAEGGTLSVDDREVTLGLYYSIS